MKIHFEDRDWEFDQGAIDLQQAIAIQLAYGFNLNDWYQGLEDADARALQCLYWLMLQQNGIVKPIKECNCPIMALAEALTEAQQAEAAAAKAAREAEKAEPDPTPLPSLPDVPPSSAPGYPTATTRTHHDLRGAAAPTA